MCEILFLIEFVVVLPFYIFREVISLASVLRSFFGFLKIFMGDVNNAFHNTSDQVYGTGLYLTHTSSYLLIPASAAVFLVMCRAG